MTASISGFFLLLCGGFGLDGLRLGEALLELVHAARGVHEFLLAGVKGMTHVANADNNRLFGGTRLDYIAACTADFGVHIFRMNSGFHKKDAYFTSKTGDDKMEVTRGGKFFVAQIFNLLYRRIAFGCQLENPAASALTAVSGLQIRDTA